MNREFPDWGSFTPERVAEELPRLIAEAERAVSAIEASGPDGFESFVWRLNDAMRPLTRCWCAVSHMLSVMNSDAWRALEEAWQPKVVEFTLRVGQSRRLYEIAKSLLAAPIGDGPEAPVRRRILEKIVQDAELAGVGLDGAKKDRFNEIQARRAKLRADFHNAVIDATNAFSFEKGGKKYTDVEYCDEDMILFGRETAGLPREFIAAHQKQAVRIPMSKDTRLRSFNLSNSVIVVLFEALRQLDFPGLE